MTNAVWTMVKLLASSSLGDQVIAAVARRLANSFSLNATEMIEFVKWVREAKEEAIKQLDKLFATPIVFSAPGEYLTDGDGNGVTNCPDCPDRHAPMVMAMWAYSQDGALN